MQLELHLDVIDDFVGEAREVLTYAPRLRLRDPSFPRLRPVSALSAMMPVRPSARPRDPSFLPHASAAINTSTSAHQPPQAYRVNRWLTYGEPLQRLREFGVTMKEVGRTWLSILHL